MAERIEFSDVDDTHPEKDRREEENKEIEKLKSSDKIKVSSSRSAFFYVDLTTKFLKDQEHVELSGLGIAVTTVVTAAEILKSQGVAELKSLRTSMVNVRERGAQKPKIEIVLFKSKNFEDVYARKQALAEENKQIKEQLHKGQEKIQQEVAAANN